VPLGRKIHRLLIQPGWPTSNMHHTVPQLVQMPFRENVGAHGGLSRMWREVATSNGVVDSVLGCQEAHRPDAPAEPQGRRPAKPLAASPAPRITNKLSKDANPGESVGRVIVPPNTSYCLERFDISHESRRNAALRCMTRWASTRFLGFCQHSTDNRRLGRAPLHYGHSRLHCKVHTESCLHSRMPVS
jgi:hypothetical protein